MWFVVWVLLYAPSLLLGYAMVASTRSRWAAALVWLTLWTLPALAYQSVWWLSDDSPYSATLPSVLFAAPVSLWVLMGGRSVVEIFEATARSLTGHRSSTMLDNVFVFIALTAIQCAVLVAWLMRRDQTRRRDPVALAIGAAVLINALLATHWPWWGT
jgi:hypothetical protein